MIYLLDTVTIIRHFSNKGKLGKRANEILTSIEKSDSVFAISIISLMEIMYLSEKNRIGIDLQKTITMISETNGYQIIDLNIEIIKAATQVHFYELHDRMIIATALWMGIPIITSDSLFSQVKDLEVIWE